MILNSSTNKIERIPSSLRDPAGFIFEHNEHIYRAVNENYKKHFDLLLSSKLYEKLVSQNILLDHQETTANALGLSLEHGVYKVLEIKRLPFISYPYEWCFSQLKNAALLTLEIQQMAMECGMTLKDASAFNVQYITEKPIFIDTLSFEEHIEGNPWIAYEQFCRHFLAPLALMSYRDDRLGQLSRIYIDGLPLDLAASFIPLQGKLNFSLFCHLILHAQAQHKFKDTSEMQMPKISSRQVMALLDNLRGLVEGLKLKQRKSVWGTYYADECTYTNKALDSKYTIVKALLNRTKPKMVWDLGSNDGKFSRLASNQNIFTIAMDGDHNSTENNYLACQREKDHYLLPLLMDLANPSPAQGWAGSETKSLVERGPADMVMALALIHHLAITHSLSLASIARAFASLCNWLIIEFIPPTDSQLKRLLQANPDSGFDERYSESVFEAEFKTFFEILERVKIEESDRVLYLVQRKSKATIQ